MRTPTNPVRRRLLATGAGAVAVAGLGRAAGALAADTAEAKLPPYVSWKDPRSMIVHTSSTLETRRTAFGSSLITPADRLYIRNNLPAPSAAIVEDRDAWEVTFAGVRTPQTLSVSQLKRMGLETIAMVLQCSGNGRGLFPTKPSGTPWSVGAAGCIEWSGVPVQAVVDSLGGVADGMRFMTSTGGETLPAGINPLSVIVERSVPLAAMQDALLAWEMNGAPIPLAHGGPLRVIVPGYTGVNSVKYVKRLAFTAVETDAAIQKTGYRMSPPGQKGDPSQPSVWEMGVKSWINSPAPEAGPVQAGPLMIRGVAFGGINALRKVDVSTDGGKSWKEARLVGADLGRYAWRQFVLPVTLTPGTYAIACRAVDSRGNVQTEGRLENTGGYSNSSWRDHSLQITVA
ncbi:MAG: sulfite oxidase [Burkholderiales bacterium]